MSLENDPEQWIDTEGKENTGWGPSLSDRKSSTKLNKSQNRTLGAKKQSENQDNNKQEYDENQEAIVFERLLDKRLADLGLAAPQKAVSGNTKIPSPASAGYGIVVAIALIAFVIIYIWYKREYEPSATPATYVSIPNTSVAISASPAVFEQFAMHVSECQSTCSAMQATLGIPCAMFTRVETNVAVANPDSPFAGQAGQCRFYSSDAFQAATSQSVTVYIAK